MDEKLRAAYEKLKVYRERTDLALKPTPLLKETFTDFDGEERPLEIRYYQVQGILHLVAMNRFLLGDDTGLGKSLMSIASCCYVWAREPDTKVVILTNKSVIGQWALEFEKFCQPGAINVLPCTGTPAKRQKVYKEFKHSSGPTVLILGYATARRDIKHLQDLAGHILITDECFTYHTPVVLADGTTELIGKIVSQKLDVEVLSWDPDAGKVEPRRITNWFRNPVPGVHGRSPSRRTRGLRKVELYWSGNVYCTPDHEFYVSDGDHLKKKPLSEITPRDQVQHLVPVAPTKDQMQIVLGSLLGDASVSQPRKTWGVSFGHSEEQRPFLDFKRDALETLGVSDYSFYPENGYSKKPYWKFRLDGNAYVTHVLRDVCDVLEPTPGRKRQKRRRRVTYEWLDRIGPLGLAVWYGDDGCLHRVTHETGTVTETITISTHNFSREEVGMLAGWLRYRWGVAARPATERKRRGEKIKTYTVLKLGVGATRAFLKILPGALPGVEWKFPDGTKRLDLDDLDLKPEPRLIPDRILKRAWYRPANEGEKYVYDIEVEGNHNYFANGTLVSNCTAYKNPSTQTYQVVRHLGAPERASRHWALTATLIKNNLIEGYGIYSLLVPGLFPSSKNRFMNEYCLTRLQPIPNSRRQIPVIIGYRNDQIARFREKIDPYFLARAKFDVAKELPVLTIREHKCGMTREQEAKYREALAGLLEKDQTEEEVETTKLTALIYCQQIVDHPELVECDGDSHKMDELFDLLTEGDFADEKVIVFSRFRKMVDKLEEVARSKRYKLKTVRVTGNEDEDQRKEAMRRFQDPNSDVRVCWITEAAKEGINLQAAKALIFYDSPWSAGDYIQVLGRMIRIGSKHDRCYAIHMVARGTIDVRVMGVLRKKMQLIEQVMGKRLKGDGMEDVVVADENSIDDLFDALQRDARRYA